MNILQLIKRQADTRPSMTDLLREMRITCRRVHSPYIDVPTITLEQETENGPRWLGLEIVGDPKAPGAYAETIATAAQDALRTPDDFGEYCRLHRIKMDKVSRQWHGAELAKARRVQAFFGHRLGEVARAM